MQLATREAGECQAIIEQGIATMVAASGQLALTIQEQADSGHMIDRSIRGVAEGLEMIGRRLTDLSAETEGIDTRAAEVRRDAGQVANGAATLDEALSTFVAGLHLRSAKVQAPA